MRIRGFIYLFCSAVWAALATAAEIPKPNASERLIVVAPKSFQPALQEFIAHKQKRRPTELHSLESILEGNVGVDDPEKIKRFLFHEWKERGLGYVLLVGDVDVLPVRYMTLDRITPAAFDYSFYPSDLYFSDLARQDGSFDDWNTRKDSFHAGYFGEVRGEKNKNDPINYDEVDYRPDIAVGRWPVSTAEEARLVAAKTITYENAARSNHTVPSRAAFFSVGGWVDTRGRLDRLTQRLTNHWTIEKRYYSDARKQPGTPPPTAKEVCSLLNSGVALAVHTGHGEAHRWADSFAIRDLARVTNGNALPIVMSAGCSTAYFAPLAPYGAYVDVEGKEHAGSDHKEVFTAPPPPPNPYQRGRFNPTGLGEQLLKQSTNGAVAYIGCNTGSQPCALTLVDGFVGAVSDEGTKTLGGCWNSAIRYYYDNEHLADLKPDSGWYPPSIFFQAMKFMLFGDPSIPIVEGRSR